MSDVIPADKMPNEDSPFATIPEALEELRSGRMVILVDDENRENEGDIVVAAEHATPEKVNFILHKARGILCLALTPERCDRLGLLPQTTENSTPTGTAFTVKIDARRGVTTGVSSADRCRTIETAIDEKALPEDLVKPGHVDCLRARAGGVLVRAGHTEGAVDLARLAGLKPAGVICEVMNPDGTMARLTQLELFAAEHGMKIVSIADLIEYRRVTERLVRCTVEVEMPTRHGPFRLYLYQCTVADETHLAMVAGDIRPGVVQTEPILVRVHSECLTGEVMGSLRCDCGPQLDAALRMVSASGKGVVLYMRQEGRGIGLENKMAAYALQDRGADTVEANRALGFKPDLRRYGVGAQILADLGLRKLRLLTNNPRKIVGLEGHGLTVVERVPLEIPAVPTNERYLRAKREKLDHMLGDI